MRLTEVKVFKEQNPDVPFLFYLRLLCGNAVKDTSKVVRSSPMHRAYRFFNVNTFKTPGGNCVTLDAVALQVKQGKEMRCSQNVKEIGDCVCKDLSQETDIIIIPTCM